LLLQLLNPNLFNSRNQLRFRCKETKQTPPSKRLTTIWIAKKQKLRI
jgi:hypothetical protein